MNHEEETMNQDQVSKEKSKKLAQGFQKLLDNFDSVTCATSDCMDRLNGMFGDLRPIGKDARLAGVAVTVHTIAGDLSSVVFAIEHAEPGDIIVVDGHASVNTAFWGENITLSAKNKGIIAAVVDGACRDVEEIRKIGFPVLARGICPNVGCMAGYGRIQERIQCAGVPVSPGDIVVIDGNGVVVVPLEQGEEVLAKTTKMMETEYLVSEKLKAGATIGQLIKIDSIMNSTFAYQEKALK
jgi:regulator of RNase E activity RraA